MDPRLLRHYNRELQHLREMGREFAEQFPRIAGRLGMNDLEVTDPYVERLLEGVSFLAARVQLKLDAEFPRFTQALLEMVYPHYLAPTPSMLVAQIVPDPGNPNLISGPRVPRGSAVTALAADADGTECEFRTAHDLRLWPIEITDVRYVSSPADLPADARSGGPPVRAALRIALRTTADVTFAQLGLDRLALYFAGAADTANRLLTLVLGHAAGAVISSPAFARAERLHPNTVRPLGFDEEQALLPVTRRGFHGYRLLQEYFSFPERYRFVELTGLDPTLRRVESRTLELVILLGAGDPVLERMVDRDSLALFCTPAINLFPKRADRIHLNDGSYEYHLVADRTRPLDFEIYEVTSVVGHGNGTDHERTFLPFYATCAETKDGESAYYTVRREPRLVGAGEVRRGSRSSYIGSEVFVALVDPQQAPFDPDLRQLSVQAYCTNRDLPLQLPAGPSGAELSLAVSAPVTCVRTVAGPSRPYGPLADGTAAWRAINHLQLNYLSLIDTAGGAGAPALRELLRLYAPAEDAAARKQIEGIGAVAASHVVRRLPAGRGPLAFGRGVEIVVTLDELAFEGTSPYVLGAVLSHFFGRHVSVNSFTEMVLRSDRRGEISRWVPQWGLRPAI
jgi:type VI secretion system protein ImpG